jgi:hypothetical protein
MGGVGGPNAVWQANSKAYRLSHTTLALCRCDAVSRISELGIGAERNHLLRRRCDEAFLPPWQSSGTPAFAVVSPWT